VDAAQPAEERVVVVRFVALESDFVVQIRPARRHREQFQILGIQPQRRHYIVSDPPRRGRGQADDWHVRECGLEEGEFLEGGAKVMAPFRDAMGLVDCDAGEFVLGVDGAEGAAEGVESAGFRGYVEEAGVGMSGLEVGEDGEFGAGGGGGVYGCGGDVGFAEGSYLVVLLSAV